MRALERDPETGTMYVIQAVVRKGEQQGCVGECLELAVVTQGATLDEVTRNLREAMALHLEGEDPARFGLAGDPPLPPSFRA